MRCTNCGHLIKPDAKVCIYCSKPVECTEEQLIIEEKIKE
jgi:uncharacterized OB-fold protein